MHSIIYAYEYILCIVTYAYVCLYINETNDNNDTIDKRKELGLFSYYKVLTTCKVV